MNINSFSYAVLKIYAVTVVAISILNELHNITGRENRHIQNSGELSGTFSQ